MPKETAARLERRVSKSGVDLRQARVSETDATHECQNLSGLGRYCLADANLSRYIFERPECISAVTRYFTWFLFGCV